MDICLYSEIKKMMCEDFEAKVLYRSGSELTRGKLLEKANQFACYLNDNEISKEDIVCIIGERSFELIACVIGILQAQGAFLLIPPEMPKNRMKYIIDEVCPRFLFKQEDVVCDFDAISLEKIYNTKFDRYIECKREPNQLAYVAYTSGSTGIPRGVMVEDCNIINYCAAYAQYLKVTKEDVIVLESPINFDGFTEEVFVPLLYGAAIAIPEKNEIKHPRLICDMIKRFNATIYVTTPLMINELNKLENIPCLRVLISAGDVLKKKYYTNLVNQIELYNFYGPTETTVCATCYHCTKEDEEFPPIGKPFENYFIDIVDEFGNSVQTGEIGEIYIGGYGVSRGYWNGEEITKQRFVLRNNKRVYCSGDYGYIDENGEIHYVGRTDRQVKINGFRVELGEIENTAIQCEGVQDAIAFIIPEKEEKILALAFVANDECNLSFLTTCIQSQLPEYMVPKQIFALDRIPVTDVGKVDYVSLRETALDKMKIEAISLHNEDLMDSRFLKVINKFGIKTMKHELLVDWDSISFIKIVLDLEDEFNISFDDEYLVKERYGNLGNLYDYVMDKVTTDDNSEDS